jgi:hypothetical protein
MVAMRIIVGAVMSFAAACQNNPSLGLGAGVLDAAGTHAPEAAFTCSSCEPSVEMSGSGSATTCTETILSAVACSNGYTFPSGYQRVTTSSKSGSDTTVLQLVYCNPGIFLAYTLAVGSSGTCADADIVHVSKIETADSPPLNVACSFAAQCSGSGG